MAARAFALFTCIAVMCLLTATWCGWFHEPATPSSARTISLGDAPAQSDATGPARTSPHVQTDAGTVDVSVSVIDTLSGKPVPECNLTFRTARSGEGRVMDAEDQVAMQTTAGEFAIRVKAPCELNVYGGAPDYVTGYGEGSARYSIPAAPALQRVELKMKRGVTFQGRVVDKVTGKPVANASVSAMIFTPPLITSSRDRHSLTDANGEFVLRGVSALLGVAVEHDDYLEQSHISVGDDAERFAAEARGSPPSFKNVVVELRKGELIRGTVRDEVGQPVPNVQVSDGAGKQVLSDASGKFELKSPRKWAGGGQQYYLSLECAGFVDEQLNIDSAPVDSLQIVLRRIPHIRGRVVNEDGMPVQKFRVVGGPGESPADFETESLDCDNARGEFDLAVNQQARNWIGVRAPGFAPWEGWIGMAPELGLVVSLQRGVVVSGRIVRPKQVEGEIRVQLVPKRPNAHEYIVSETPARDLATEFAITDPDGAFRFDHVRPDRYFLYVKGAGITPTVQSTIVPANDLQIEEQQLQPAGRITGRVFDRESGVPVPFANGEWSFSLGEEEVEGKFKADVSGAFAIDQAPAGVVKVRIPFQATADIIGAHVRDAVVRPNLTTRVSFFEPTKSGLTVNFQVGDGSKPAFDRAAGFSSERIVQNVTDRHPLFHLSLSPLTEVGSSYPSADWEFLGEAFPYRATLPDLTPGRYQLRVGDWIGGRYSNTQLTTVEFDKGNEPTEVNVPLGVGCLTGRVVAPDGAGRSVRVFAVSDDRKSARAVYGDSKGDFCIRYLPAGRWTIVAWGQEAGWNQLQSIAEGSDPKDLGDIVLRPGGRIEGNVSRQVEGVPPLTLIAKHEDGVVVESPLKHERDGLKYLVASLWPGEWSIILLSGTREIGRSTTHMGGTEKKAVDIGHDRRLE